MPATTHIDATKSCKMEPLATRVTRPVTTDSEAGWR